MAKKIELLHTTYDDAGNIESQEVVHPLTSPDCIIMENGKTLDEVMGDGIATPTLTHEGTSFKVGVGDSNIEVVDGDVAGMTLKGQSYQNILPKPTTLIMETDEQEFKINDKIDSNIIIDDNIAEIATVKGKTIVNAVQEESGSEYIVLGEDLSGQSIVTTEKAEGNVKGVTLQGQTLVNTIQEPCKDDYVVLGAEDGFTGQSGTISDTVQGGINGAVLEGMTLVNLATHECFWNGYSTVGEYLTQPLKRNTKYMIILNSIENVQCVSLASNSWHIMQTLMGTEDNGSYKGELVQKKVFTFNVSEDDVNTVTNIRILLSPDPTSAPDYQVMLLEYQEGMENWDIPFFEGMKSVQMPVVKTTGKNLFGICEFEKGVMEGFPNENVTITNNSIALGEIGASVTVKLKGKPNTEYTISFTVNNTSTMNLREWGDRTQTADVNGEVTWSYGSYNLNTNNGLYKLENIQIEEGSIATTYEPYQSSTVTTEKNIFDGQLGADTLWDATGEPSSESLTQHKYTLSYMSCNANEQYELHIKPGTSGYYGVIKVYYYDKDKNYLSLHESVALGLTSTQENKIQLTIQNNSNIAYMRFRFYKPNDVTTYTEATVDYLTIKQVYTLRAIGDVKDELDLQSGKLTQRIGEIVLDGSEDWVEESETTSYYTPLNALNIKLNPNADNILCDRFRYRLELEEPVIGTCSLGGQRGAKNGNLLINYDGLTGGVENFKNYLKQNPLTVQVQIEECIKTIDLQVTDQDNNTIPHIQTQPTVTHITTSSDYLIPTVTIDNNLVYDVVIKPSTLYTIRFKHDTVNTDNPLTVNLGGTELEVTSTEFTITTPETLVDNTLVFSGKNNVVSEVQVIEGDVTSIEYPFFEGMNDVKFSDSKFVGRGKNLLIPSILNPIITNSTQNHAGVNFTYNSDGSFTMFGTFTDNITLHGNADEFIKLLKHGARYRTSEMMLMEVFSLDGNTRWTNDLTFDKNNHIRVSPYYQWNGVTGESINKTYYPQVEIGDSQTSYEPYKGVEVQQDVDSIPLTSGMFEQGYYDYNSIIKNISLQQVPKQASDGRIRVKSLIKVKPNTTYTINSNIYIWALAFGKNGEYLGYRFGTQNEIYTDTFTTDSYTHYIAPILLNSELSTIVPSHLDSMNLILQEVPQEIVLRGIGDVKDELDLTRGEYIQRIGEIKFNESQYDFNQEMIPNSCAAALYPKPTKQKISSYNLKCDKLPTVAGVSGDAAIYENPANIVIFDKTISSKQEFIQKYNDCTIQYVLETPIIHKVNLTNTKVIPSYATETYYEAITPSDSLIPNITIPSTLNYDVAIKPSTEYTIRANTVDALTVDLGGTTGTLTDGKVTLTTPATLTHNEVKFSGTGSVKELMVVEGSEIKDNVPFFNGMKDVQMGGIKLVNIARGMTLTGADVLSINTNKTQITYNGTVNTFRTIKFDSALLKPNTVYTIYLNITENTSALKNPIKFLYNGDNYFVDLGGTGIKKVVVTTPNVLRGRIEMAFRPCTTSQKIVVQNPMIIEGDWTHLDEIPYIESEMIIDQPIIRSQGKNLLDLSQFETATDEGKEVVYIGDYIPNIKFKENTQYIVKFTSRYREGYATKVKIKHTDGSELETMFSSTTFTKNSIVSTQNKTVQYIRFWQNINDSELSCGVYVKNETWIEEGSTATSYEPFKHQTLYSNRVIGYEENCYYTYDSGTRVTHGDMHTIIADVEGLSIAYVACGSSSFSFWDKDGVYISGKQFLDSTLSKFDANGFITVPSNAKYIKYPSSIVYENKPYYTKATVTGDLPLRSLPNGVCDTLNLVTGEYVQRVGEVVLDGSESWVNREDVMVTKTNTIGFYKGNNGKHSVGAIISDNLREITDGEMYSGDVEGINPFQGNIRIRIAKNKLLTQDINGFKQYLSQNPITVQYELATPIVRKLGFTTKGNYREQVLDGSEGWRSEAIAGGRIRMVISTSPLTNSINSSPIFTDGYYVRLVGVETDNTYEYIYYSGTSMYINIKQKNVETLDTTGCTQWLSQNPIKVGYISSVQSSESYSNIHKPIFFNNVDVQYLPNNVDIQPELTLQARTRNSYVMDMMKANTKYSIKLLDSSGNMTIDGISYTLTNSRTFISPSTLTNKELIILGEWYEPMIIEGDVTGKNLPYFKGILSSYHDVDEIEIYSINKNLFDINEVFAQKTLTKPIIENIGANEYKITRKPMDFSIHGGYDYGQVFSVNMKKGETISFSGYGKGFVNARIYKDYNYFENEVDSHSFKDLENYEYFNIQRIATQDCVFCCRLWMNSDDAYVKNIQVEKSSSATSYIPHTHNTTLIEMPTRLETVKIVRPVLEKGAIDNTNGEPCESANGTEIRLPFIPVQPSEILSFRNGNDYRAMNVHLYDIDKNFIKYIYTNGTGDLVVPNNAYFIRGFARQTNTSNLTITRQAWKPIQLNSLPNGVYDEIIMKPNSNKAQLVQRVGKVVLDGSEDWLKHDAWSQGDILCVHTPITDRLTGGFAYSDRFEGLKAQEAIEGDVAVHECIRYNASSNVLYIFINKDRLSGENDYSIKEYLKDNPLTVYYQCNPITHEIQLKGYPHVYEDGTVTLNTDTPHQTLVSYNVNQEQLINNQNETIIRHDKQIDDLYYYIELYLEEIYQMELFRMKLELSL